MVVVGIPVVVVVGVTVVVVVVVGVTQALPLQLEPAGQQERELFVPHPTNGCGHTQPLLFVPQISFGAQH